MADEIRELKAKTLKYIDGQQIDTITINSDGMAKISDIPDGVNKLLFTTVIRWTSNTGAFSVINNWTVGNPGTVIKGLQVRYWYME